MGNKFFILMKKAFALPVVFLFFLPLPQAPKWVAPAEASQVVNPFKGNAEAMAKGEKTYKQLCFICHGNKGKGDGAAGAALNPAPTNFTTESFLSQTDGAIFWKLTNGRTPMAAYKDILTEEQRWQVVCYIRHLGQDNKKK